MCTAIEMRLHSIKRFRQGYAQADRIKAEAGIEWIGQRIEALAKKS